MNLQADPTPTDASIESKESPIMIYNRQSLIWGKAISKPAIRVSIWLNTEMAPMYMSVSDAKVILMGSTTPKTFNYPILSVHTQQVIAYHLLPPADEAPYFDPDEPNRKMEPVTAVVGNLHFDGNIRMSAQTDVDNYLNVSKANFLELFDITASFPMVPSLGNVQAPFMLLRQSEAIIMPKA